MKRGARSVQCLTGAVDPLGSVGEGEGSGFEAL
jgi:hypothetical protein